MPTPLPLRKSWPADANIRRVLDTWAIVMAAICFTLALAEGVAMTPALYRDGFSTAVYEAMLQSP